MKKMILIAFFGLIMPTLSHGSGLTHYISVKIGPFAAAQVKLSYDITPKNYAFNSKVATDGVFGSVYPFSAEYETSGSIHQNKLITKDYRYKSATKTHTRTKQLVFDTKGHLDYRLSSKDGDAKKVEIELPSATFNAHDLQTVFAALTRQFQQNKFCAMDKIVFDGKKRYKVNFQDEGKTTLNDQDVPFKGDAWQCSMYISQLDQDSGDMLWEATADRPVHFWIMQDQSQQMPFVAKVEISSTPLGRLKAYTTKIENKD